MVIINTGGTLLPVFLFIRTIKKHYRNDKS